MLTAFVHYPPAIVERAVTLVRDYADTARQMRRIRPVVVPDLVEPAPPRLDAHEEHRPFFLPHWLPNMPRGHEDRVRGGVRAINADLCRMGALAC